MHKHFSKLAPGAVAPRGRILVVDDDPLSRELILGCLGGEYDILQAASGAEALALAAREAVGLVLLDVMLPDGSGLEVCRELKRRAEGRGRLPVLLLTGLSDGDEERAGLAAGADDYLAKPVGRRELRSRIGAFLGLRPEAPPVSG